MVKVISLHFILFTVLFSAKSQSVYKSYSKLVKKDLYSAQKGFDKKIKRYPAQSAFGLSLCYTEPSYLNIDSSMKYLLIAEDTWADVSEKSLSKLASYGIVKKSLERQKEILGDLFYERCILVNEPQCFDLLLHTQPWNKNLSRIIHKRDSLFYINAQINATTEDIQALLNKYPQTLFKSKLNALRDSLELRNGVKTNTEAELAAFIDAHPDNRFIGPMQDSLYQFFNKSDVDLYLSFIQKYPSNRNIRRAWESIYKLETNYYHPALLNVFARSYPEYPYKEELAEDIRLSNLRLYPFQDSSVSESTFGYANEVGEWVIPPRNEFEEPTFFSQGYAVVGIDGQYGVIDKRGVEIVPFIYDEIELLENSLILVSSNGLFGLLNRDGSIRHAVNYTQIIDIDSLYYSLYQGEQSELYCINSSAPMFFESSELELLHSNYYLTYASDGMKVGLYKPDSNCELKEVMSISYGEIYKFGDDSFVAELKNELKIISDSNTIMTDSIYGFISSVHDGYSLAQKESGVGYLNSKGQEVIDFNFEPFVGMIHSGLFHRGYAIVKSDGLFGVIDTLGNYKSPPNFEQLIYLEGPYGVKSGNTWSVLSHDLDSITPSVFTSIDAMGDGFVLYNENGKYGMMDAQLNSLFPPVYRSIKKFKNYFVTVGCGEDLHYIMNSTGALVSTKGFTSVKRLSKNHLLVKIKNKIGYFRLSDGKLIMQ